MSGSRISTALLGSAVPLTVVPSGSPFSSSVLATLSTVGATGAVVSPVAVAGSESLPASSMATT
ncbi:hypothetical protein ACFFH6_16880, partial [Halomonas organivorans]|uniref:hypothetical protein n=1 Tax=Halomonas organivorans TaxID=257772 RepID=UPI0035F281CA